MIKAGVIGLGVGEAHIQGYQSHSGCVVSTVCDIDASIEKRIKEKYPNIRFTQNADDILSDKNIQVVSIASYDNFHCEQIIKALRNEKHIFVEKPLCLYPHEAQAIRNELELRPHLKMSSNLILRKTPRFIELKEMISSGKMGKIFHIEGDYNYGRIHKITEGWRGKLDFYSITYGGGVHLVDLVQWLTNETVEEVFAYGNKIGSQDTSFKFNSMCVAILKFKNGLTCKIASNFCCVQPHFHQLQVYGTESTFINRSNEAELYTSRDPQVKPTPISSAYPGTQKGDLLFDFIDSITNDKDPIVSKNDVFKAMSVCFAIEESMNLTKPIKVKYL